MPEDGPAAVGGRWAPRAPEKCQGLAPAAPVATTCRRSQARRSGASAAACPCRCACSGTRPLAECGQRGTLVPAAAGELQRAMGGAAPARHAWPGRRDIAAAPGRRAVQRTSQSLPLQACYRPCERQGRAGSVRLVRVPATIIGFHCRQRARDAAGRLQRPSRTRPALPACTHVLRTLQGARTPVPGSTRGAVGATRPPVCTRLRTRSRPAPTEHPDGRL